jgi:O-antigen ligase
MDTARINQSERAGTPPLLVLVGLLSALVIGSLLAANVGAAFGFAAFLALFCLIMLHPAALAPALVVLSVFIEKALQPLTITVGGVEMLNFCGVVNLCLLFTIIFYVATDRIRPFESLITGSFALYCAVVAFSLLFSVDVLMTLRSIVRISAAYCIYLIITQFVTEKRQIDRTFQALVLISVIPIAVGLYQVAHENHFVVSRDIRVRGTFKNGMSYAMYLALILPYIFGQVFSRQARPARRYFFGGVFLAGLVNLVYTSTRIGWGVFALAMIVYATLSNAKKLLPTMLVLLLLSVVVFSPFFAKSFGGYLRTDLKTYLSNDVSWDERGQDYITASSLHIRVFVWRHMLRKLRDSNFFLGLGSGTWFENVDKQMIGFPIASHSDYFEVLFGTGLVGLSIYLLFRIRQLTLLARFAKSGAERSIKTTILFPCLAAHVACLGMSITEVWQSYSGIYWLSWITFGISESYYKWYCLQGCDLPATAEAASGPQPIEKAWPPN